MTRTDDQAGMLTRSSAAQLGHAGRTQCGMGSNLCIGVANSPDPRLVLENCTVNPTQQWQPDS